MLVKIMGIAGEGLREDRVAITQLEQEILLRLEQNVVAAYTAWLEKQFSVPIVITLAGMAVTSAADALAICAAPQRSYHCLFRLDGEEKQIFCLPEEDAQKILRRLRQDRQNMRSPDFFFENYDKVVAKVFAEALLAQPEFLPVRTTTGRLLPADLPAEPFLRFDYEITVDGDTYRLVRFVSMRLLSAITAATSTSGAYVLTPHAEVADEISQSVPPVEKVEFAPLSSENTSGTNSNSIEMLYDLNLNVIAELGRTKMQIREILELGRGSVVEIDKLAGDPVDLYINDKKLGEGEVVVVDDHFGVRITNLLTAAERVKNLGE